MEESNETAATMQAGPIEITERATEPPPPPKPVNRVTYTAVYGDYKAEMEIGGYTSMVSAYRRDPNKGFTAANPPMELLDPAFAAWLERFMAECQRRYEARNKVGVVEQMTNNGSIGTGAWTPHAFEADPNDAQRVPHGQEDIPHCAVCGQAEDRPVHRGGRS